MAYTHMSAARDMVYFVRREVKRCLSFCVVERWPGSSYVAYYAGKVGELRTWAVVVEGLGDDTLANEIDAWATALTRYARTCGEVGL